MINSHVDFICYAQICRFQYFFRLLMGCYRNCMIIVYQVNDSISFKLYWRFIVIISIQVKPVMTCYKLVTAEFKWFGLQTRVESFIMKAEHRLFTSFHRWLSATSSALLFA